MGTNVLSIEVPDFLREKLATGIDYFDQVLSGGLTPSTVTLFTGTSGAGKSTMTQLIADGLTKNGCYVVVILGEESPYQSRMTSQRLGLKSGYAMVTETHLPTLMPWIRKKQASLPKGQRMVIIADSLQTLNDGKYGEDLTNSKTDIRSLQIITEFCKETATSAIVIGQVNKAGKMAGSNKLKHMVDVHIHLSIEEKDEDLKGCRLLEVTKNRFGFSGSVTFLKMEPWGFAKMASAIAGEDGEDDEE